MARCLTPLLLTLALVAGCTSAQRGPWNPSAAGLMPGENPIFVPAMDREFLWNQIVDAVDDDFRIEREQRMQAIAGVVTEGMIEAFPRTGSTILEPWHGDSTWGFQRRYATLQSIRRRATVRVSPTQDGYLVGVGVSVELEDLGRPEGATAGSFLLPYDGQIDRSKAVKYTGSGTLGWIPMGRDTSLEQKILADIRDRVSRVGPIVPPANPPSQGGWLHRVQ
jgi:hypothetical protein